MSAAADRLVQIMARLRSPEGCPWDIKQNFKSIAPHTLEEAYEVVEAIEHDDMEHLREELGDLLLQVVFYAQMASEQALFTFDDVAQTISEKLIDRHPHVFADRDNFRTANDVLKNWEADKAAKRDKKAIAENRVPSILDGLNTALPALMRSLKLSQRMARVGFDWPKISDVIAKIREEVDELDEEIQSKTSQQAIEEELGDVMFALINLARFCDVDPETALRKCNRKIERRFRSIESRLAEKNRTVQDSSLDEMEQLWCDIKAEEKEQK